MRKITFLLMTVVLLASLTSCHSDGDDVSSGGGSYVSSEASSTDTASTATPAETATPEPTETPTPIPTVRPDGLWNVEGMTVTYSAVLDDGTLVIYDEVTRQLLKYDPEAVAFATLCAVKADDSVRYITPQGVVLVSADDEEVYVDCQTGQQTDGYPFLVDGIEYWYSQDRESLVGCGTEFAVKRDDGYTWYQYPERLDNYGKVYGMILCSGRYLACVYYTEEDTEEFLEEKFHFLIYDYQTDKLICCPLELNWSTFDLDTTFEYVGGTTVLIDGNIIDVTDLPEEGEELKTVDYDFDSFLRKGDTLYYTYNRSVRTLSAEGESQEIYRYTADERVIREYVLTESGRVVVMVDEGGWPPKNGSVYVGDTCVCEEADYLIYADDSNIIVSKDGILHLIPMP